MPALAIISDDLAEAVDKRLAATTSEAETEVPFDRNWIALSTQLAVLIQAFRIDFEQQHRPTCAPVGAITKAKYCDQQSRTGDLGKQYG